MSRVRRPSKPSLLSPPFALTICCRPRLWTSASSVRPLIPLQQLVIFLQRWLAALKANCYSLTSYNHKYCAAAIVPFGTVPFCEMLCSNNCTVLRLWKCVIGLSCSWRILSRCVEAAKRMAWNIHGSKWQACIHETGRDNTCLPCSIRETVGEIASWSVDRRVVSRDMLIWGHKKVWRTMPEKKWHVPSRLNRVRYRRVYSQKAESRRVITITWAIL